MENTGSCLKSKAGITGNRKEEVGNAEKEYNLEIALSAA